MSLLEIDHLAIAVHDLEASIANWRDNFGLTLDRRARSEALGIDQAYMAMPNGGFIELFTPMNEESPMAQVLAESGEGFKAMTMAVDDVEATIAELTEKGVRTFKQGETTVLHAKSSTGLIISLMNMQND